MKKFLNRISETPLIAMSIAVLVHLVFIGVIVMISRYSEIHQSTFLLIILSLLLLILLLDTSLFLAFVLNKGVFKKISIIYVISLLILGGLGGFYIYRVQVAVDGIFKPDETEQVEFSLIAFDDENNLDQKKVGYVSSADNFLEVMKEALQPLSRTFTYIEFQSYEDLLDAQLVSDIDLAILPKKYKYLFEKYEGEFDVTHILSTFTLAKDKPVNQVNVLTQPFTLMIVGLNDGLSDSMMLATFNPDLMKVTISSIPRDSYVPIACYSGKASDKINHSRGISRTCMLETVEDLLDVSIDFYFEADFYALVKMVDAVGGLELTSPVSFTGSLPDEDIDGLYHPVSVSQGTSLMNGQQAVTFARERKHMPSGDFDRQRNQQYVLKELLAKMISTRNPSALLDILDVASKNFSTNIPQDALVSLIGYGIDAVSNSPVGALDTFRISQNQILGTTPMYKGVSIVNPYVDDIMTTSDLVNQNLLTDIVLQESYGFDFSFDDPYSVLIDQTWSGKTLNTLKDDIIVPDFLGQKESVAKAWAQKFGLGIDLVYDDTLLESDDMLIYNQSLEAGTVYEEGMFLKIGVYRYRKTELLKIPQFKGKQESSIVDWFKLYPKFTYSVSYQDDLQQAGLVMSQSLAAETEVDAKVKLHIDFVVGRKPIEEEPDPSDEKPEEENPVTEVPAP